MADENKKFPNGWGDDDDDDYNSPFGNDDDDEDSAWGNSSPFKKSKPVVSGNSDYKADAETQSVTSDNNDAPVTPSVQPSPIQEVRQPENSKTSAAPANRGYVVQKQKTSPVLIILIIVLVLIIGILGGMFFMMNKSSEKKDVSSSESSENSTRSTTEDSEYKSNDDIVDKRIKQEVLNDIAKSFNVDADLALIEMDEEGYNIDGYFIIASDKKYNYNVPINNFDEDVFYEKINYYIDDDNSGFAWFVVIDDQSCFFAAASESWDTAKNTGYYVEGDRRLVAQCEPKNLDDNNIGVLYEHLKSLESTITAADSESEEVADQYTSDEVSAMFSAYITENPDPNRTYDNSDYGYALIDLNNDGTQELLVTEGEMEKGSPWIIGVYTIKNSELTLLMGFDPRFPGLLYEDNIISYYSSLGQGGGTAFYKYTSDDSLDMVDIISYDYSSDTKVMYHNGNVITEAESYSILANYIPIQFEPKSLKINIQPTTSAPTETYAFYGIVATDSDSLNLRDKPSTDSKVITQLPKGTKASVYYVEGYSEWYKIYTDNGYEGYVASQYMKEYNEYNNDASYVPGTQTPFGTFTYTNYYSSAYSSYTIYEPDTIGIYLNCDIDAFNAKHSDYRIDNIYFWTVKKYSSEGPHDYRMYFTFTGTVLSDSIDGASPALCLTNEKTGDKSVVGTNGFKATLYKGETFCYDMISGYDYGEYVLDNTTYTLS